MVVNVLGNSLILIVTLWLLIEILRVWRCVPEALGDEVVIEIGSGSPR